MERINLKRFGFIRSPEDDFSDDGNRFTCYRLDGCPKIRLSKCMSYGDAFIDADVRDGRLPYEIYAKLPHYRGLSRLNGVAANSITEDDLQRLHDDCIAYVKEYEEAVAQTKYPSVDEIVAKAVAQLEDDKKAFAALNAVITVEDLLRLSDYQMKNFKNYYTSLKKAAEDDERPERIKGIYGHSSSFDYVRKPVERSWYYKACLELIEDSKKRG